MPHKLTDAVLEGIAAQALNMVKRDMEQGEFHFLLGCYHEDPVNPANGGFHRMTRCEEMIITMLGANWLDDEERKDAGFDVLRFATKMLPPDAVVIVTACDRFGPGERYNTLTEAQKKVLALGPHDQHHKAVRDGYLAISEAILAVVQTEERVCLCGQDLVNGKPEGPPHASFVPQKEFSGRLKMYGRKSRYTGGRVAN
jgi:hypothetical protein